MTTSAKPVSRLHCPSAFPLPAQKHRYPDVWIREMFSIAFRRFRSPAPVSIPTIPYPLPSRLHCLSAFPLPGTQQGRWQDEGGQRVSIAFRRFRSPAHRHRVRHRRTLHRVSIAFRRFRSPAPSSGTGDCRLLSSSLHCLSAFPLPGTLLRPTASVAMSLQSPLPFGVSAPRHRSCH